MRILVGMLAHQLHSEVVRRVHSQQWGGHDGYDVLTMWGGDIRPDEDRFQAVTRKYQDLQRMFLAGHWDALLTVEQDMLIPPDALVRLAQLVEDGADIAYALYVWRYDAQHWWSAHPHIEADADGKPWFSSLCHFPDQARAHWGQPVIVDGLGFGCTLITRQVLTRLPFRQSHGDHCHDTALALDAKAEGFIQICDTGAVCGHMLDATRVIWPDPTSDTLYTITEG